MAYCHRRQVATVGVDQVLGIASDSQAYIQKCCKANKL